MTTAPVAVIGMHRSGTSCLAGCLENLGLNLGVYGAPETFLIDSKGIIRHKFVGVIDETVWREQLAGKYQALVDEAKP